MYVDVLSPSPERIVVRAFGKEYCNAMKHFFLSDSFD